MKKSLGLFVAAAALAIAPATGVFADSTDGSTPSAPSDPTTTATASIATGDLTYANVTSSAKVADVTTTDAFNSGIQGQSTGGVEVDDFLGTDNNWNLTVKSSGWTDNDASQQDATSINALNGGTLSYAAPDTDGQTGYTATGASNITSTATSVASGTEGQADLTGGAFNFIVPKGANILAGNYSNTLTWSLTDTPANPS